MLFAVAAGQNPATLDGVTFASHPGKILAPVRTIFEALGLSVEFSDGTVRVSGQALDKNGPTLPDGTRLVPLQELRSWNVEVTWQPEDERAVLSYKGKAIYVRPGPKRVVIDKSRQELRAMQGSLLVMKTNVSTGRRGKATPNGSFQAGPYKARMHRSSLYDDAPMPYSVQIVGDIFVHGYSSVPGYPASHGCIRMPIDGTARFFFEWVDVGTPVEITGRWRA
ncbi:hypothetical protein EON79_07715 [bacterium]|nr:MAG: hypothetical protein EON79_07715 [bacterium]